MRVCERKYACICVCELGCMCWGGEKERKYVCERESERQGKESMKRLRQNETEWQCKIISNT